MLKDDDTSIRKISDS